MTRLINRPVDVTIGPGGLPVSFRLRGARQQVQEVRDSWLESGRWWEQESERVTYRVSTTSNGLYELTWEPDRKRWYLYRTYD